jgi:amino acid permease
MASQENINEKGLVTDQAHYVKSDDYSAELTDVVPERKLKRQLKNRHVAMIRFATSNHGLLTSNKPCCSVLAVL